VFACCDESGIHTQSRWWVIGAFWLPDDAHLPSYEAEVTALRQRTKCWGEFKWEKVGSKSPLKAYQDFLRLTLGLPDLRFTSIVVDTDLFTPADMKKYHEDGGRREAYLKFMRLLLQKRIAGFVRGGHRDFTLLYDRLSAVPQPLARDFRRILADDMKRIAVGAGVKCQFVHLSPVNSAGVHLVQAADLLTGATRAAWQNEPATEAKQAARDAVSSVITGWAGADLTHMGFSPSRYYNLWKWRPSA
jgi:hypothetical protein